MVWTVNQPQHMMEAVRWEVDAILTDVTKTWLDLRSALQSECHLRRIYVFYMFFQAIMIKSDHNMDVDFFGRHWDFIPHLFSLVVDGVCGIW
jgi:hypothetical protein